jgi:hypothetical protein
MNIDFTAKTNRPYCLINTAKFKLKNGSIITLDRKETEWSINNDCLSMTWKNVYIWEIDGCNIFDFEVPVNNELCALLNDANLLELEIEDDADSDYSVTEVNYSL